ncbi:MAG TPA: paraquat-inducible protein A [Opitutaceae bacterium]|nr:paraquat-inducible protein A [Opitutaceae bacterium]
MLEPTILTPRRRALVATMLAVSFACNLAVLFLPFMDLRRVLSREPYSLVNSIAMLWDSGLYVLAVLVVGFSVVFPFAKLGVLASVCLAGRIDARNRGPLEWVERLGKWSMLDVFLVCLILSLTSGQVLVGAEPRVGIPVFIAAVVLNMAAGELLVRAAAPKTDAASAGDRGAGSPGGALRLALGGAALAGAVAFPLLGINDWLLADRRYSILALALTLWREGAVLPSLLTGVFLVLAPAAGWAAGARAWWQARRGRSAAAADALARLFGRWAMLDVFGLALAIFAVEGDLMETEVRWGALFLAALIAIQWGSGHLAAARSPGENPGS